MSVTISVHPSASVPAAAFRPVLFDVLSNRYANAVAAVTSVSSGTGSRARYAVSSNVYAVGDVVLGSAFTGLNVAYNVAQTVTAISATYFETNLSFVASATGAGTMTRTNNNFQIKCETYVFDSSETVVTSVTSDGGLAQLHVASHNYVSGDLIFVRGTTDYNGIIPVLSVTGTTITTLSTYVSSQTGVTRLGRIIGTKRQSAIIESGVTKFRLNCAGHLQSVLKPDLIDSAPANIQTPCVNSMKVFCVYFSEEWDDVNGILQAHDTKLSDRFYATRATWQHKETQNLNAYILGSSSIKFLTNAPLIKRIRVGEEEQLHFITNGLQSCEVSCLKYDLGGNPTLVSLSTVPIIDNKGIVPINSNLFDSNVSKIIVGIYSGATLLAEVRTFIIDKNRYQNAQRFHFENTLGGFDAFTFTGAFSRVGKSAKTNFKKNLAVAYAVRDRGVSDLSNNNDIANQIYSGLLSNAEALWLNEMLQSTAVFTKNIGETVFTPVNILSDSQPIYDPEMPTQLKVLYSESNQPLGLSN